MNECNTGVSIQPVLNSTTTSSSNPSASPVPVPVQHGNSCIFDDESKGSSIGILGQDVLYQEHNKGLNILQWNVNGIGSHSGYVSTVWDNTHSDIIMVQELQTKYNILFQPKQFRHYNLVGKGLFKTGIYIKDHIKHIEIPIDLVERGKVNTLYITGASVLVKINGNSQWIIILSLYMSPSGKLVIEDLDNYLDQIRLWKSSKSSLCFGGTILGGDLNACHTLWGAPEKFQYDYRYIKGDELVEKINNHAFTILGTGQPTRYQWRRIKGSNDRTLYTSWIDISICKGFNSRNIKQEVLMEPVGPDHFPIMIQLGSCQPVTHERIEDQSFVWKLKDTPGLWDKFGAAVCKGWKSLQDQLEIPNDSMALVAKKQCLDKYGEAIIGLYHHAANSIFGGTQREMIWPKWITEEAKKASIAYHRYWRKMKKKSRINSQHWRKLKDLRRTRNRLMKRLKQEWLRSKFNEHHLNGKEGWQIASEIRDMNESRGKPVPSILDENDTKCVLASTAKEKTDLLLEWYHRFDNLPVLPANSGYNSVTLGWEYDASDKRRWHKQDNTELPPVSKIYRRYHPKDHSDAGNVVSDYGSLDRQYKRWLYQMVKDRWTECNKIHRREIDILNGSITSVEVRRAIQSFDNNKAFGPDQMHIKFFKKTPVISTKILTVFLNLCMDVGYVPVSLKKRWIIPLLKPGKKGTIRKDWRPISLTSYIAKIFEKVLCYRLVTYIVKLKLIDSVHFAYMRGKSTQDCIIYIVDRIMRSMNQNKATHCVFFDFSSAFDTVRYNVLIWKLQNEYFITGAFLNIIISFLSERSSAVKFLGQLSEWRHDSIGVPQGGALSPILFIMYTNSLGIISKLIGVYIGIFADDICIFTGGTSTIKEKMNNQLALQEGVLLVQWYSLVNGLRLNYDKTGYKLFCKNRTFDNLKWTIKISSVINNNFLPMVERMQDDTTIKYLSEPVKYLGIWFDDGLKWNYHKNKILTRCQKMLYVINSNIHKLWGIKANILYQILNACILSILDYSSVIILLMKEKEKVELRTFYNSIIRRIFSVKRHTPLYAIFHQLQALDFDNRIRFGVSKQFSHMLRLPVSSVLSSIVYNEWWKTIKCMVQGRHNNYTLARGRYKKHVNTVIWKICEVAIGTNCSDIECISKDTKFYGISKEISYYNDLSKDWRKINFNDVPFTDNWYTSSVNDASQELLAFTDGSVERRTGGYGYHVISGAVYIGGLHGDQYTYNAHCGQSKHMILHQDRASPVATRCSIDFCEAFAIRDCLYDISKLMADTAMKSQRGKSWDRDYLHNTWNLRRVRIVSDSLTVLRWLNGDYRVRNHVMQDILDDIYWQSSSLLANYNQCDGVIFQWTRSHEGTKGNEQADVLAKQGMSQCGYLLKDYKWKYYSKKAVNTEMYQYFKEAMQIDFRLKSTKSRVSVMYNRFQIGWHSVYKKELFYLNRNEIRLLMMLRTGHCDLPYYRNKLRLFRRDQVDPPFSTMCTICGLPEDLDHLFFECNRYSLQQCRRNLRKEIVKIYQRISLDDTLAPNNWVLSGVDFDSMETWLFPDTRFNITIRIQILRIALEMGRYCLGQDYERG